MQTLLRAGAFLGLVALLFAPWELLSRRPSRRKGWRCDVLHGLLNPLLVNLLSAALLAGLAAGLALLVPRSLPSAVAAQPWWLQLGQVVLLAELAGYWLHRGLHSHPWLWRLHAVHHSSEQVDWLAAQRQHPLETALLLGAANLPALVMGFPLEGLAGLVLFQKLHTVFVHANLDIDLGPFRWLIAGPRFHHVHHSADARDHNSNFSSLLPCLDLLFGSHRDARDLPRGYGTSTPVPRSWIGQLLAPFRSARRPKPAEPPLASSFLDASCPARRSPISG